MTLEKADLEYFDRGKIENAKYWSRLGEIPSFEGLNVLDVGCGHGSLCVDVASKGAKRIYGIDTDKHRINFARENVSINYPQFKDIIEFRACDIFDIPTTEFDILLSKDTLEHILHLDLVLAEMKKKLKPGGRIYLGFGPLYNAYNGDHSWTRAFLPWGHLIFPESWLLKRINRHRKKKIRTIYELELNKLSLAEYKKLFYASGLHILYFRVNVNNNPISKLFSLLRKIPFLTEYFSHNLYCIMEKR